MVPLYCGTGIVMWYRVLLHSVLWYWNSYVVQGTAVSSIVVQGTAVSSIVVLNSHVVQGTAVFSIVVLE